MPVERRIAQPSIGWIPMVRQIEADDPKFRSHTLSHFRRRFCATENPIVILASYVQALTSEIFGTLFVCRDGLKVDLIKVHCVPSFSWERVKLKDGAHNGRRRG